MTLKFSDVLAETRSKKRESDLTNLAHIYVRLEEREAELRTMREEAARLGALDPIPLDALSSLHRKVNRS